MMPYTDRRALGGTQHDRVGHRLLHIGIGIGIGFAYIFFDKVSTTYAVDAAS